MNTDLKQYLIDTIADTIRGEVFLRDVPYSMQEGDQELDPDSVQDAAIAIVNQLMNSGIIK